MRKRRIHKPVGPDPSFVKLSSDRRIVLLDQEPLREAAGRAARKKIGEMEKLATLLDEFENSILPAYARWEAETLGPLLEEERQLNARIDRLEHLISRIGMEALFTGRSPFDIFEEAIREEEEWEEPEDRPETEAPESEEARDPDAERNFSEEEREFRSYVRYATGNDPDQFGKREYKKLFKEYREWRQNRESESASAAAKKEDVPARVKELYRVLVRRLHPDTGKSRNDPNSQRLWHDLQDAYAGMDVERLEILLALTDLHESGGAIRSTLYHLRKVAKEMERTVREMKFRFRDAKSSPAWTFWHSSNREKTAEKFRAAVQVRIRDAKKHIATLEEEIDFWKKNSPRRNKKKPVAKGQKSKKTPPPAFGEKAAAPPPKSSRKSTKGSKEQGLFDF